jgi:hypothetical protein
MAVLTNGSEPEVRNGMEPIREDPVLAEFLEWSEASGVPLTLIHDASGLEWLGSRPVEGRPNRCLLKIFPVAENRYAAFFYKRSQVPFSRDRFAYGAVVFHQSKRSREQAETWFAWVDGGFHPENPPQGLRRAFNFTVPD